MIHYHTEGINFNFKSKRKTLAWIKKTIENEGFSLNELNYIFCSDEYLLQVNIEYLQHDTLTDIITFPYATAPIEGDIFISIERVRDNAKDFNVPFEQELRRVIIHGVLHLCGYGDKTDKQAAIMRQKEEAALAVYNV